MIEKELTHLARQLSRSYGFNKNSDKPCHLTLANLNKSSKTFQVCCDKNDGFANYILNQSEQAVHELYDKDSIVYLTPDSDQVITYRTRAIITRSWFETALDYKTLILDPKIENKSLFST